ncbi:hypothetical protein [Borreliella andersonii]|uniref:hypothetical protein n=1 Tax=Borrelia andersonii TaxID=42109 RepID=UPI003BA16877
MKKLLLIELLPKLTRPWKIKIRDMHWQILSLPAEEYDRASKALQPKIQKLYADFVKTYESEFKILNETDKNNLMQAKQKGQEIIKQVKSFYDHFSDFVVAMANETSKILNQEAEESII